jgi:hypothetical protein
MLVDAHTIRLGISFDRPAITSGRKTVVVGEVSMMVLIMVISVMDDGCQIARSLDMIEGRPIFLLYFLHQFSITTVVFKSDIVAALSKTTFRIVVASGTGEE